ncbi:MAG: FKBP-type peptidyl-prolyl cis-trans isomerase [Treponema sp.]|nr:FKBP-type peptidyl-prolyl cis-trans isomerase [Treponema sp.]
MKYIRKVPFAALFLCVLVLGACNRGEKAASPPLDGDVFGKDASYALGMSLGSDLKVNNILFDMDEFIQGFKQASAGEKTRFDTGEAEMIIQAAYSAMMDKQYEKNRQAGIDFMVENSRKPGIITTSSGLQYEIISEGTGAKPTADDVVRVNYEGTLTDGTVFDSSYQRGQPAEFPLSHVISGWTEGIQLMRVGSVYRFYIPSDLAYGSRGAGQMIPPHAPLIFEVELLSILDY